MVSVGRASAALQYAAGAALAVAVVISFLVIANTSRAAAPYDNGTIASVALRYVGQKGGTACAEARKPGDSGGQCRAFVNCVVWMASAGRQNLGGSDYFQPFLAAGGRQITDMSQLQRGDIVQEGQGLHTFIIVRHIGGNVFNVVDSNNDGSETVLNYNRSVSLNITNRAYRMGIVPVTADQLTNGHFIQAEGSRQVYVMAGGAALPVYDWSSVGGPQPVAEVTLAVLNGLTKVPADGTYLRTADGAVWVVAGGSPLHVTAWPQVGGIHPYVSIDKRVFDTVLAKQPRDGTYITGYGSGRAYVMAGGSPFYITDWAALGGPKPAVVVDDWVITHDLPTYPRDNTYVITPTTQTTYRLSGGQYYTATPAPSGVVPTAIDAWHIGRSLVPDAK